MYEIRRDDVRVALLADDCPRVIRAAYLAAATLEHRAVEEERSALRNSRGGSVTAAWRNLATIAARRARQYWVARGC